MESSCRGLCTELGKGQWYRLKLGVFCGDLNLHGIEDTNESWLSVIVQKSWN